VPVYEYRCRACQAEFERYLPTAGAAVACPRCASPQVMRRLSVFGLRTEGGAQPSMTSGGGGCCGGGCGCH
jgi:putative FmdB family regulatory protein